MILRFLFKYKHEYISGHYLKVIQIGLDNSWMLTYGFCLDGVKLISKIKGSELLRHDLLSLNKMVYLTCF